MYQKKKKVEFDMGKQDFYKLTHNQKLAILYFLSVIATGDNKLTRPNDCPAFINHCYRIFRVTGDQVLAYVAIGGREQTVMELKKMHQYNFFMLICTTSELLCLNGGGRDEKYQALLDWLDDLEMTEDEWYDYEVKKNDD